MAFRNGFGARKKKPMGKMTITVFEDGSGNVDIHIGPPGDFDIDVAAGEDVSIIYEIDVVGRVVGERGGQGDWKEDVDQEEEEDDE